VGAEQNNLIDEVTPGKALAEFQEDSWRFTWQGLEAVRGKP
jgi:hypothetical protein